MLNFLNGIICILLHWRKKLTLAIVCSKYWKRLEEIFRNLGIPAIFSKWQNDKISDLSFIAQPMRPTDFPVLFSSFLGMDNLINQLKLEMLHFNNAVAKVNNKKFWDKIILSIWKKYLFEVQWLSMWKYLMIKG